MALVNGSILTATANGDSNRISLQEGSYSVVVTCSSWGSATATLKVGRNGKFVTAKDAAGDDVIVSADTVLVIEGGLEYYFVVANYNSSTITADFGRGSK